MRPDQHLLPHLPIEPIYVGFAGQIGAGKTSAARYLSARYGFQYARYSQILEEWLSSGPPDRNRLQTLGWEVMSGGQQLELNRRLIAVLDPSRNGAIDGLRHPVDFDSLSGAFGASFRLIFLEARQEVRSERLRSQFSADTAFQAAEAAPVEAQIDGLKVRAHATISNEGSLEKLYQELDAWVATREMGSH